MAKEFCDCSYFFPFFGQISHHPPYKNRRAINPPHFVYVSALMKIEEKPKKAESKP